MPQQAQTVGSGSESRSVTAVRRRTEVVHERVVGAPNRSYSLRNRSGRSRAIVRVGHRSPSRRYAACPRDRDGARCERDSRLQDVVDGSRIGQPGRDDPSTPLSFARAPQLSTFGYWAGGPGGARIPACIS